MKLTKKIFFTLCAILGLGFFSPVQIFSQITINPSDYDDYDEWEEADEDLYDGYGYDDDSLEVEDGTEDVLSDYDSTGDENADDVEVEYFSFVFDTLNLMTNEEQVIMDDHLIELADTYGIGLYIITIDDYTDYADDIEKAGEEIYKLNEYGVGEKRSALQFLISMNDRSYDIYAVGDGEAAFDKKRRTILEESFLDDFGNDNWHTGFSDFVNTAENYLRNDKANNVNYDERFQEIKNSERKTFFMMALGIAIIVALLYAIGRLLAERRKMKNVAAAEEANKYINETGSEISEKTDNYLYSRSHTVVIESSRSSGSSGGSHSSGHF